MAWMEKMGIVALYLVVLGGFMHHLHMLARRASGEQVESEVWEFSK